MSSHRRFRARHHSAAGSEGTTARWNRRAWGPVIRIAIAVSALGWFTTTSPAKDRKIRPMAVAKATESTSEPEAKRPVSLPDGGREDLSGLPAAAAQAPAGNANLPAGSRKIRLPLSRISGGNCVRLLGQEAEWRLVVPMNPRMRVNAVTAGLSVVPSITLAESTSRITVQWNGQPLEPGADPARKEHGAGWVTGTVRPEPTEAGGGELLVRAVHGGMGERAGKWTSREVLWSEIDLEASWIELDFGWRAPEPDAAEFARLACCRPWLESRIAVVTPSLDDGNDDYLHWGGWMAQWIALTGGAEMPELNHRTALAGADSDAVVMGAHSDLPQLLPPGWPGYSGGEDVRIFPNPENPRYLVLLLSGTNREAVGRNVRQFVEKYPAQAVVDGAAEVLAPGSPFSFLVRDRAGEPGAGAELGFHTAGRDSDTVAAIWMLAGRIAQITGAAPGAARFTGLSPSGDGDWILAGPISRIDRKILASAPVALGGRTGLPVLLAPPSARAGGGDGGGGQSVQPGGKGGEGLLMRFPSPFAEGRVATVITADDSAELRRAVKMLLEPKIWRRITGDTVSWGGRRGDDVECRDFAAARPARRGDLRPAVFFSNSWIPIGLGLAGLAALAMLRRKLPRRRRSCPFGLDPGEGRPAAL